MIREKIRARMREQGVTQKTLCEDMGITLQNFSTYLSGARGIPFSRLLTVLDYLGLTFRLGEADGTTANGNGLRALVELAIKCRGMKLKEYAAESGIHYSTLSSFINGRRNLSCECLEAVVEQLGIELCARAKE